MNNNSINLRPALALARKGIYVHPLKPGAKQPLTERGYLDATIDEATIRTWWTKWPNANIGVACKQSKIVIVDIDQHPGRSDGLANFKKLEGRQKLPKTVKVKTPHGWQYWFRAPKGIEFNGNLCDEVQLKHKGYGIAPPSLHPSGREYKYINSLDDCDVALLPEWMYPHAIKSTNKTKTEPAKGNGINNDDISDKEVEEIGRYFRQASMPDANAEQVIQNCPFLKHCCVDDVENLSEPEWYNGTIGVLSYSVDGADAVHKYSASYPNYNFEETQNKLEHWQADGKGPTTCKTIQELVGNQYCKKCPFNKKIKSPIVLGYSNKKLEEDTKKPIAFPIDVFPAVFADYAIAAARSIRCPIDYCFGVILALVSILLGNFVSIQLTPDWRRYAVIWLALVGPPGYKKSPAVEIIINALKPILDLLERDYKFYSALYDEELQEYTIKISQWKKDKNSTAPMPVEPVKPELKQLIASDTTIEALVEILAKNSSSMGMVVDELTFWFRSMNQYKARGGGDRSHWLSIRNNMPFTVNRKGQEPVYVKTPFVPVVGGIQPDLLSEIRKNEMDIKDGFLERVSYMCPNKSTIPVRDSQPIPDNVKRKFHKYVERLFRGRASGNRVIELSPDANERFMDAQTEWDDIINSPDFPHELEGFYAKAPGQLGELILILHEMARVVGEIDSDIVPEEIVVKAKRLADYFLAHARLALGLLSASREERQVEQAVKWIKSKSLAVVKARDFLTNKVAGCKKTTEAVNLMKAVSDYGWGHFDPETNTLIFPTSVSKSAKNAKATQEDI